MNYADKYLKYKAKYVAAKVELHIRKISVLEHDIKGRIIKMKNSEDQKKRGIESLKKNNTPVNEINEFINSMNSEIDDIKKELIIKNKELEIQKIC